LITGQAMKKLLANLSLIKQFPSGEDQQQALAEYIVKFAETDEQLDWLGERAVDLCREWPGAIELRGIFCSRFKPKDGKSIIATAFGEDGIAREKEEQRERERLPEGVKASVDPAIEETIVSLAKAKDIKRRAPVAVPNFPVDAVPPEYRIPPTPQVVAPPPERRITQADVDREVQKLREKNARRELDGGKESSNAE
jgi:hypothetical protein